MKTCTVASGRARVINTIAAAAVVSPVAVVATAAAVITSSPATDTNTNNAEIVVLTVKVGTFVTVLRKQCFNLFNLIRKTSSIPLCMSCASIFTIVLGFLAVTLVGLNSVTQHPVLY